MRYTMIMVIAGAVLAAAGCGPAQVAGTPSTTSAAPSEATSTYSPGPQVDWQGYLATLTALGANTGDDQLDLAYGYTACQLIAEGFELPDVRAGLQQHGLSEDDAGYLVDAAASILCGPPG